VKRLKKKYTQKNTEERNLKKTLDEFQDFLGAKRRTEYRNHQIEQQSWWTYNFTGRACLSILENGDDISFKTFAPSIFSKTFYSIFI